MAIVLTIGGMDTWGGGGIGTDIKAIEDTGAFALSVITCVATTDPQTGFKIHSIDPQVVEDQLKTIKESFILDAIKIGLLPNPQIIDLVISFIDTQTCPIVVDPVMAFKETKEDLAEFRADMARLIKGSTISTPNLQEAAILTATPEINNIQAVQRVASQYFQQYESPVLIKGGSRLAGPLALDLLYDGQDFQSFEKEKLSSITVNGAGCALSSYLAAYLAQGQSLQEAIVHSKEKVYQAIKGGLSHSGQVQGNVWKRREQ